MMFSTRKKAIWLVAGSGVVLIIGVIIYLITSGKWNFKADTTNQVISNTSIVKYCLPNEGQDVCNPSTGKYSHQLPSNTVTTEIIPIDKTTYTFSLIIKNRLLDPNTQQPRCPALTGNLTLKPVGSSTPVLDKEPVTLGADCKLTLTRDTAFAGGNYDITLSLSTLLSRTIPNTPLAANPINLGQFLSGDFNGNQCIQMDDWSRMSGLWGSSAQSNPFFDLKGEGQEIGMEDWGVLSGNWDQGTGCNPY